MSPLVVVTVTQGTRDEYQNCDEFAHRVTYRRKYSRLRDIIRWVFRLALPEEHSPRKSINQFAQAILGGLKDRYAVANQ